MSPKRVIVAEPNDEIIPLTAKVFDLLLVFLENNGRLLGKEEVMRRIWQDSFVEEGNLARNVSTLRKALGENRKSHQYIVTIPGYGYKFVASINEVQERPAIPVIAEQTVATTVLEEEISLPVVSAAPLGLSATRQDLTAIQETKQGRTKLFLIGAVCLVVMALIAQLILRKENRIRASRRTPIYNLLQNLQAA